MNQTNFSGPCGPPENSPVDMFPADPSTTLTGELDGKAAGGAFSLEPMQEGAEKTIASVREWWMLTDSGLRLRCGELTSDEIRTIRAVLASILNHPTTDAN